MPFTEIKQRSIRDWQDHYGIHENYAKVFADRTALDDKMLTRKLSSSEWNQYTVLNHLIDD